MRSKAIFTGIVCLLCAASAFGQGRGGGGQAAAPPKTDMVTPEVPGVVKAGTKIEIVKYGLGGDDAGVGMPDGSVLISTGGGVGKVDSSGNLTMLVANAQQAAGLAMDSKGRIFAAQYSKKVSIVYPMDAARTLTDSFDGKPYIRPNDLVVDKKGGVYFTDCYQAQAKPKEGDLPQAVYYIKPDLKTVIRVVDDIARPNGITLSPNGKILYVNDWDGPYLVAYDVQRDGTLKNKRNFGKFTLKQETDTGLVSGADGLCIDSKSDLYSTTPAGVQVFNAKGEHLADIDAPYPMPPQNCGFSGPDKHYLYVVGRGVIYRILTIPAGYKGRAK